MKIRDLLSPLAYQTRPVTRQCIATGFIPETPMVLFDVDDKPDNQKTIEKYKLDFIFYSGQYDDSHYYFIMDDAMKDQYHKGCFHWAIYDTKHGFHFAKQVRSWDDAQEGLYILKSLTGKSYIMNCRKQRLRISTKIDYISGEEVSPAPWITNGCEHTYMSPNAKEMNIDIRIGRKELYSTSD